MTFDVEITDAALAAIRAQVKYIAIECRAPLNAGRWLERVWDAIDGLALMPERHGLAAEDEFKPYEVRRVLVGNYLILFTIEKKARKVWVIGFRHGSRLPRPGELPEQSPGANAGD
jgi:plasmid stabilization system protein ParE